jgi:hypothetical protein
VVFSLVFSVWYQIGIRARLLKSMALRGHRTQQLQKRLQRVKASLIMMALIMNWIMKF